MKFGFDIGGVVDKHPVVYSFLTRRLVRLGHEVHIITGHEITLEFIEQLTAWKIAWTHLFSIVDHHRKIGTEIWYDYKDTPWLNDHLWNRTKGDYCALHKIDMHIDDSKVYGAFFVPPTVYMRVL